MMTILVDHNLLPDELIQDVGKVGQQEGEHHSHRQVGCLDLCPGQQALPWQVLGVSILETE